jgi:hypothetical protein
MFEVRACDGGGNGGLEIQDPGVVEGLVFFDANGNRTPDAADSPLANVGIRLLARATSDTVARTQTDANGLFQLRRVPVGTYDLAVAPATIGDTVKVVGIDPAPVVVQPAESVVATIAISFERFSVAEARALPAGSRVFVEGTALNSIETFGDRSIHLAGASAAIRVTRMTTDLVFAGDRIRVRGAIAIQDGQPTIDETVAFMLSVAGVPQPALVTTSEASTAGGGSLDAALVRVSAAVIADTLTVVEGFQMEVDDGSGPLQVLADQDIPFQNLASLATGATVDVTGVLVPIPGATPESWRLKPRSNADLTLQP